MRVLNHQFQGGDMKTHKEGRIHEGFMTEVQPCSHIVIVICLVTSVSQPQ